MHVWWLWWPHLGGRFTDFGLFSVFSAVRPEAKELEALESTPDFFYRLDIPSGHSGEEAVRGSRNIAVVATLQGRPHPCFAAQKSVFGSDFSTRQSGIELCLLRAPWGDQMSLCA